MIGFNASTCQKIIDNGFNTISSLSTVGNEELSDLVKHIGRCKGTPPLVVDGQPDPVTINLPYISVKKLRPMRMWVIIQRRKGKTILAASCTNDAITQMIQHTAYVFSIRNSAVKHPKVPDILTSFTQWRTWSKS